MPQSRKPKWPILAGVLAGAAGAVIASLVSLPLRSPDDLIGNTATVTLAALALGIAGGLYWRRVHQAADGRRKLMIWAAIGFGISVVLLVILELAVLDRFITFGVPLAAIIFGAIAWLTPLLTDMKLPIWAPLVAVIVAFLVGGLLAGFGDAESGDLSLDDIPVVTAGPTSPAPVTTAASGTTAQPGTTSEPPVLVGLLAELEATSFTFSEGTATWSVPETFVSSGLDVTAVGRSESLAGSVDLAGVSEFTVDLTTFMTDQNRRDSRVRDIFSADPIATFTTDSLTLPESYADGEVVATTVTGDLTVNGVTRTVTWTIEARLTGTQLDVTGELDIALSDFDVTPPSIGGFVTVEDSARLEVLFSAIP